MAADIPERAGKITQAELAELFGNEMPIEAGQLLWWSNDILPTSEVREKLCAFAEKWKAGRPSPDLLSDTERKQLLADAEALWRRLEANDIGGFSGINRPFYILYAFKEVIEKYGRRDVGLSWSKNALEGAKEEASQTPTSKTKPE